MTIQLERTQSKQHMTLAGVIDGQKAWILVGVV